MAATELGNIGLEELGSAEAEDPGVSTEGGTAARVNEVKAALSKHGVSDDAISLAAQSDSFDEYCEAVEA